MGIVTRGGLGVLPGAVYFSDAEKKLTTEGTEMRLSMSAATESKILQSNQNHFVFYIRFEAVSFRRS